MSSYRHKYTLKEEVSAEYYSQSDALMGSSLGAMSFTAAAIIRDMFSDSRNILLALPAGVILMSLFRFTAASTTVTLKRAKREAYYASLRLETQAEQDEREETERRFHTAAERLLSRGKKVEYTTRQAVEAAVNKLELGQRPAYTRLHGPKKLVVDYTIPHLIDIVYNPLMIPVDMSMFLARMFGQLVGMLLMTYTAALTIPVTAILFAFFMVAKQAYDASNAPPTPPPSPVSERKNK
jgi:hypothetical protein